MSILFAVTLLVSSALLFLVQPMAAKMVLPILGGTPAVWNTSMVFFQAGLLAGYAGAHFLPRWLGVRWHAVLHVGALALSFAFLPLFIDRDIDPPAWPALWLLGTFLVAIGLPYVVVATSGPLLQKWFAYVGDRDPYYLYAASNLGSFAGLLAYPFVIEPWLTLQQQALAWTWGCGLLLALTTVCGAVVYFSPKAQAPNRALLRTAAKQQVTYQQRLRWVLLALVPSSLMLSVTNFLTADIAPIPFLWVIPIALYLLTFSLVFARRPLLPHWIFVRWQPAVVIVLLFVYLSEGTDPLVLILILYLLAFFWFAMVCHGELARTRPGVEHLTEFYLWLAVGGMLGGMFNALIAPLIFTAYVEYPIMIVAACLLRPAFEEREGKPKTVSLSWQVADWTVPLALGIGTALVVVILQSQGLAAGPISVAAMFGLPALILYTFLERPIRFGLGLGAIFLASALYHGVNGAATVRLRSFFGVHRVSERDGFRRIMHGNTLHGLQRVDETGRPEPLAYFTRQGPVGKFFESLQGDARLDRVGIVGLGAGAMASYAERGQQWTFFEIDPDVVKLAKTWFTFLDQSRAEIAIELGDARLNLHKYRGTFGVFVVDAFGSDAIPIHLLTREALALYSSKLDDDGLLVFHISNRHLDLEPVLANLAEAAKPKLTAWIARDLRKEDPQTGRSPSAWMVLARDRQTLVKLRHGSPHWSWTRARPRPNLRPWTDDFSNLFQVFRWGR